MFSDLTIFVYKTLPRQGSIAILSFEPSPQLANNGCILVLLVEALCISLFPLSETFLTNNGPKFSIRIVEKS